MISGRIIGEVVQDGVAHYKKRREIHDQDKLFTEAHGELGIVFMYAFFLIFIIVVLLILAPFLHDLIKTENDKNVIIALYIFAGLEIPVVIYAFLYFKTWRLKRDENKLILRKFWKYWVINLPEMKQAVQNGRKVKRTARHYWLPMEDGYCKINITQTYGAVQVVEAALLDCGIDPLPKVGSKFYE